MTTQPHRPAARIARAPAAPRLLAALLLAPLLVGWAPLPATAQQAPAQPAAAQPVEVSADALEVDQAGGTALFTGNVTVVQGALRLAADSVRVEYGADEASGGRTQIRRLHAVGNVVLTTADEAAEAAEAVYDVPAGQIVLTGDVVLAQAGSAIAGDRLVYDLATRSGRMEGRVRTVLLPDGAQ